MLRKIIAWFVIFGLSWFVADVFHWTDRGIAFVIISFIAWIIYETYQKELLFIVFNCDIKVPIYIATVLETLGSMAIALLASYLIQKIFGIDFYATYQLISFGYCLCNEETNLNFTQIDDCSDDEVFPEDESDDDK